MLAVHPNFDGIGDGGDDYFAVVGHGRIWKRNLARGWESLTCFLPTHLQSWIGCKAKK